MTVVLEDGGRYAIFNGRRYQQIPDYNFSTSFDVRSLERTVTLSLNDEHHEVTGTAAFRDRQRHIVMMDAHHRNAEVIVIFSTFEEGEYEREGQPVTREQTRRWPCWLAYEADERTGRLQRWRLVLDMPRLTIRRVAELAASAGLTGLTLDISLSGLYVPDGELNQYGLPTGSYAYLLPRPSWEGKTPRLFGYVSLLHVNQQVLGR